MRRRLLGSTGGGIPAVEAAGIPVLEVHEGAKRPGMRIIPDSLRVWESLGTMAGFCVQ
jgi:hypothetical protein